MGMSGPPGPGMMGMGGPPGPGMMGMGGPMMGMGGPGMGGPTMAAKPKKKKKKAKIKPKTKMKPLHWTKYNMKKAKGTIFEVMDDDEVRDILFADGEEDKFVELFGVKKKA